MNRAAAARRLQRGVLVMLAAAAIGGASTPSEAQPPAAIATADSLTAARAARRIGDVLARIVTLHLDNATLEVALRALARQGDLRFSYSSDVVPVSRRVSVSRTLAPAGEVLRELLHGTGVDYVVTPSGYVVLVRSPMPSLIAHDESANGNGEVRPVAERVPIRTQIMDRVLVMGTPAAGAPERELPSAVTVLTADQIAALGPASMEDLFRVGIPGVVAWDLGIAGPFAQLGSVRGSSSFTANYLKTYVDGVELASPYLLFAIDPYSIERIEVIRGPQGSALYGSDAISGVVHVVTRRGSAASHWRPRLDALLSAGLVESRFIEGASASQRHSAMVSTGGGVSSMGVGGTWAATGEVVPEGSSGYRSFFGGVRHFAGVFRIEGTLRYADVRFHAPANPLLRTGDELTEEDLALVRPVLADQRIENETYGLTLDARPGDGVRHTLIVGLDRHAGAIPPQREPATVADALLGATRERVSKLSFRYSSAFRVFQGPAAEGRVTFGADRTELLRERLGTVGVTNGATTDLSALYRDDIANTGVFAQFKLDAGRSFFLTAGLRGDRNSTFGDQIGTAWSPMVGAAWVRDVGAATLKLRTAYGRGIRPPPPSARQELTTLSYIQLGNPGLQPESQSGVESGVELYVGDRVSLAVTGYAQDADGLIQQVILDRTTLRAIQYQNVGRIANRGLEIEGSARRGALRANLNFALTDSRVKALSSSYSGELNVGDRVPEVPSASGQGSLSWDLGRSELTIGSTYIGSWTGYDWREFILDESVPGSGTPLRSYLRRYSPLARPFVAVSQSLGRDLTWFGRIDNLTNEQRNERDNLQITAGRTMTVGLRIGR